MLNFWRICKMIYNFFYPVAILPAQFFFIFSNLNFKYTFYYTYVINLNYWETNLLFICLFYSFYSFLRSRFLLFILNIVTLKLSIFPFLLFSKSLLTTLIVGTVVLHPLGFYFFTVLFLFRFFYLSTHFLTVRLKVSLQWLSFFLTITLFLGSIWAVQSNSWGYFWVNDAVEWILISSILYILYFLHIWSLQLRVVNFFYCLLLLLNILFLVRLNFLPTRHNFISTKLTVYMLFFIYIIFLEFFNSISVFFKKYNYFTWTKLLFLFFVLLVFINNFLLLCKYISICFILSFFIFRINSLVKGYYFHLFFMTFIFLWIVFFNFFFLNYKYLVPVLPVDLIIFSSNLSLIYVFFKQSFFFKLLEFVTFTLSEYAYSLFLNIPNYSVTIILNNFYLLILLYLGFVIFL